MIIKAYLLAADPVWIEASVLSYYDIVEEIIVSYDNNKLGWTGTPIGVDECIERALAIDKDKKIRLCPGDYARLDHTPMENDTYQRRRALAEVGDADWILQLDTDEVLPNASAFAQRLQEEVPPQYAAVDWPMRTFFQRAKNGAYLEVCSILRQPVSAFPGPVAVRPGAVLTEARHTQDAKWRYDVRPKDMDPADGGRVVNTVIPVGEAIIHLSWVRSESEIRAKLSSWSHSHDFNWQEYLDQKWLGASRHWWALYNFHPVVSNWWPALRPDRLERVKGAMAPSLRHQGLTYR